ncbi:predicted protein [Naegleria gruberi]|uniref:Predicted protein n=1 Tax=Naegleria gruberi TaxID=5762 RepID=D2VWW6_NAEGR|nr:uncharacterized protein NAEGRDRAFT_73529 [Naegleria gruberi]EFC38700.1 predicted protein [Naegleria gruberi]|eukprot:XP_002671444.1 predicted protein [Naegleria gruberi strain NEG-M]
MSTYSMLETSSTLSLLLNMSIRDPLVLQAPSRTKYYEPYGFVLDADNLDDDDDDEDEKLALKNGNTEGVENNARKEEEENNEDDDDEEDEEGEQKLFYNSHCFIDQLLLRSLQNQFIGRMGNRDKHHEWKYKTRNGELCDPSEYDCFKDGPQFHDKFEEWIDAYSEKKSWILQLLLEISLGREMIEYLGMRNVGFCIVQYFHKLFEPAIRTVENWKENPKSILEFSDIFNSNLYELLEMAMKKETILKDNMSDFWFQMETISNSIPRQVILFIAENFSHLNIRLGEGEEMTCSVFIFQELRKFGICVEKLQFLDKRSKFGNFERTSFLNSVIPEISDGFYLQHFAVWIKSIPLLEWCLDVDSTQMNQTLAECLQKPNQSILNVKMNSYAKTYLVDKLPFTILHYAVSMCNVEMVELLTNKYLANPVFETTYHAVSPLSLAIRNSKNVGKGRNNEEDEIMKIFSKHYQSEIEKQGTSSSVGSESKTFETDGRTYEEDNSDLDEEYYSDYSYDIPPHQNVVVEQWNTKIYDTLGVTDFSDDEYEEGLDFKQLGHIFKNLENEANNPLKRKRFDPLAFEDYSQNFIENRLKNTIAPFESNTWDYDLKQEFEGELTENIPAIKILQEKV